MTAGRKWIGSLLLSLPAPLRSLRNVPILGSLAHRLSHRILPSDEKVWARVERGPGQGLWLELNPRTGQQYLHGEVEPAIQEVLAENLKPGMVFYDLGANIGFFSLLAARLVGATGKVFSFEPDPEIAGRLCRNIAQNGFTNVTVVQAGIWSASGNVNFVAADLSSPDRGVGKFVAGEGATAGTPTRCIALDDFIVGAPAPDAIKCDIEGAEVEAFRGAEKLIEARHPLILCEMHSDANARFLRDYFIRFGYGLESVDALHILGNAAAGGEMSAKRIVALVGRRDAPTDGVADYCAWLGGAMGRYSYEFETFRVDWLKRGWRPALADLQEKAVAWHGCWVLLQFTTLAWSRRGFPLRAPRILDALGKSGLHCGVVFHDFEPLGGSRWIDHARHYCQLRVLESLYERAERAIFTVPIEKISWLPPHHDKAAFIPVGANCPEPPPGAWTDTHGAKTIAVYGVTGGARTLPEVADISFAIKRASRAVGRLHVIVFGRGSREAESAMRAEFAGVDVEVETLGLLSPDDVSRTLARADVMLFVRSRIFSRRGSAIAGIACGLPVVCYAGPDTGWPITEAGILPVPLGDREALSGALEKVLSDDALRNALCQRSRRAQEQYFSWRAIAARYADTLGVPGTASTSGVAVAAAEVLRTS